MIFCLSRYVLLCVYEKTKELQKDWKGYGKSQVLFGIVVFVIFVLSALYYYIL